MATKKKKELKCYCSSFYMDGKFLLSACARSQSRAVEDASRALSRIRAGRLYRAGGYLVRDSRRVPCKDL